MKFPSEDTVRMFGVEVQSDSIQVNEGWNLIGMVSSPISVACVETKGTTTILSPFFEYSTGYAATETLQPCKAYWVKVSQSGELVFRSCSLSTKAGRSVKR